MAWFSACVRFAVLVDGIGINSYWQSVFVFRATSWDEAFARALELGRAQEMTYDNVDGDEVRQRLVKVETLNELELEELDGAEVYCDRFEPPQGDDTPFNAEFRPEAYQPL